MDRRRLPETRSPSVQRSRAGVPIHPQQDEDHWRAPRANPSEAPRPPLRAKAMRSLFLPDPGKLDGFTVEISTDKGVKGIGSGGIAGGQIVEGHLVKLLLGEDPFDVERLWDIQWRSTMSYGRTGPVINAISGVDSHSGT